MPRAGAEGTLCCEKDIADALSPGQVVVDEQEGRALTAPFQQCLRCEEMDCHDAVIDSRSVVIDEAENRLHRKKAILKSLLAPNVGHRFKPRSGGRSETTASAVGRVGRRGWLLWRSCRRVTPWATDLLPLPRLRSRKIQGPNQNW